MNVRARKSRHHSAPPPELSGAANVISKQVIEVHPALSLYTLRTAPNDRQLFAGIQQNRLSVFLSPLDINLSRLHSTRPYLYLIHPDFLRSTTVANSPQAKKRAKQAEKRRNHNASLRSMVRTYIKNVIKAIDAKDLEQAKTAYTAAVPVIDRMADKGIIDKNKAARHKSRLNAHIKAMAEAA
tara:strand:+ start:3219 stop:3767 length:549 start_codon:yes stop_codon:yes gene_type:complete